MFRKDVTEYYNAPRRSSTLSTIDVRNSDDTPGGSLETRDKRAAAMLYEP
jgi:hypothetical protein